MSFKHSQPGQYADGNDVRWLWVLVPFFVSIFFLPKVFSEFRSAGRSSLTQVGRSADQIQVVTMNEQSWRPFGYPETIPLGQMQFAGKSREGFPVYVRVLSGGGGGPSRDSQLYMKLADGRYQPLQRARNRT